MAFNGVLLQIGSSEIVKFVKQDSYKISPAQRQDLDSFVNANGVLERNVLPHRRSKIEINTIPMDNTKMAELWGIINANFISESERKVPLTYYRQDIDDYASGSFYIPDPQFPINRIDRKNKKIYYDSMTLKFIEY